MKFYVQYVFVTGLLLSFFCCFRLSLQKILELTNTCVICRPYIETEIKRISIPVFGSEISMYFSPDSFVVQRVYPNFLKKAFHLVD